MKKMKKLASLVLALAMALTLAVPAMAVPTKTTISVADGDTRTYEVYQIFVGDLSDGVLSNLKWGQNGTTKTGVVSEDSLSALEAVNGADKTDVEKLEVIKTYVDMSSAPIATISAGNSAEVDTGYYLMKDVTENLGEGEEQSTFVVKVVGAVTVSPKVDDTTMIKKVKDVNDSTGATTDWQDSADYDIGDDVPFQLTGTVSDNIAFYDDYYYAFHDELSAGLSFNNDVKVYVDGVKLTNTDTTTYYTVKTPGTCNTSCDFEVVFTDLKEVPGVNANSVITVEYTAKLIGENVVIGGAGNPNTAYLEYSNEPYSDGTGKTKEDKVVVFTYKVIVNKVDENNNPLAGAKFTLYKKNAEGVYVPIGNPVTPTVPEGGNVANLFGWKGLDDGDYKLVESKTPDGYNTMADLEFTISAEHETDSQNPTLLSLNGGNLGTGDVSTGAITRNIENQSGATLPETGGMGTTLFYALGAVLVIGAGVAMVTKKRMG